MFCCPTLIGGLVLFIIFIVFLAKRKKSLRIQNRVNTLKDKANSWDESEVIKFDPRTKILEDDFNEMTGTFLENHSKLCHDDCVSFHIHELLKVWSKNDKIILMLRCHISTKYFNSNMIITRSIKEKNCCSQLG